jgi:hypothetical protein
MPPATNRYSRRYHPFSRPLTLHTLFPMERPTCLPHSLYTIHPIDCDVTSVDPPQPLLSKTAAVLTASEYFIMLERHHPNKIYEKPKGEVGRNDPRVGYSLLAALKWPTEVYKEVQVGYSSHSFSILISAMVRPNYTSSPAKSYPWLHLQIRHPIIWMPFIRTYVTYFVQCLRSYRSGLTGS